MSQGELDFCGNSGGNFVRQGTTERPKLLRLGRVKFKMKKEGKGGKKEGKKRKKKERKKKRRKTKRRKKRKKRGGRSWEKGGGGKGGGKSRKSRENIPEGLHLLVLSLSLTLVSSSQKAGPKFQMKPPGKKKLPDPTRSILDQGKMGKALSRCSSRPGSGLDLNLPNLGFFMTPGSLFPL